MITIILQDILNKSASDLYDTIYPDDSNICYEIYIFRDKDCVLYVGYSSDVIERLRRHLGIGNQHSGASISGFYKEYKALSSEWEIDLYTQEDCEELLQRKFGRWHTMEKAMIGHFHPCINSANNRQPGQLPEQYREYVNLEYLNNNAVDYLNF